LSDGGQLINSSTHTSRIGRPKRCARPGTWKRYEGISQGLLDEFGDEHVDEITAPTVRAFMAVLGKPASSRADP
jgi:hypothetical protein